jgi:AbrB family looped-hinge helix DNA binding protein
MENLIVSARGQLTLPAKLRKRLGIEPGSVVVAEEKDGALVLRPAVVLPIRIYTDEEIAEWTADDAMSEVDLAALKTRLSRLP